MKRMQKWLTLAVAAIVAGCASITGSDWVYVYNAQRMHPEGWYEDAYVQVEECAKQYVPIPEGKAYRYIEWFMVPANAMVRPNGAIAIGTYSPPRRIFLDERWVMEGYVIVHELTHYITNVDHGDPETWALLEHGCILPLSGYDAVPPEFRTHPT